MTRINMHIMASDSQSIDLCWTWFSKMQTANAETLNCIESDDSWKCANA